MSRKRGQTRRKRNAEAEAAADRARAEALRRRQAETVELPPLRDNVSAGGDDGADRKEGRTT
jgi:hypothetical protein